MERSFMPPGEYDRAIHVQGRYGFTSNYSDYLLLWLL